MPLSIPCTHDDRKRSLGCFFCITGKEEVIAKGIELLRPDMRVTPLRQIKRKTLCGQTTRHEQIIMPGYLFFEAPDDDWPKPKVDGIVRALHTDDGRWQLKGKDEAFARWVLDMDGLLTFSKAYQEGERVRFISGPLKDFEGSILKVDRRNKNGLVEVTFHQTVRRIWMGFDLVERVGANSEG